MNLYSADFSTELNKHIMTRFLIVSIFFLIYINKNIAQIKGNAIVQRQDRRIQKPICVKAMTNEITEEDTVKSIIGDIQYTLYPNGKIAVLEIKTNKTKTFHLKTKLIISTAYFLHYKDNLIIYYVDTDYDGGASFIECYNRKTLKMEWRNKIGGFNLKSPIVIDSITYMATIGFVGKLNLNNGKYIWKHDNLYESTKFDFFDSISIEGTNVCFTKDSTGTLYQKYGKVIVNNVTGKIKQIIKNN